MSIPLEQLRSELKSLPRDVLADLVHSVLDDAGGDSREWTGEVEEAWGREAHRRWEAYLQGSEEMIPLEDAMTRLRARLRR
ncbi:MAG TPA: addiction module protein [Longimicrobium sp.]|jgi:hypothetical protein|uniref:addiction module protein n=1 Tax=Longimicrobium sp. TaxID=2029185 RepID=UPI002ED79948